MSVIELAVPVWHSSLTLILANKLDIERVQRAALQIILGYDYDSYPSAWDQENLLTLDERRNKLCKKFTFKAARHSKHNKWFKVNAKVSRTRQKQPLYCPVISRTTRFEKSPISYMTKLLNMHGIRIRK